jgi:hypothetical protein
MAGVVGLMVLALTIYSFSVFMAVWHRKEGSGGGQQDNFMWLRGKLGEFDSLIGYVGYFHDTNPLRAKAKMPLTRRDPLVSFGFLLADLTLLVCVLAALSVVLSLPTYILKELDVESAHEEGSEAKYVTHTYLYNWLWTMAYLSGNIPAAILLSLTLVCLLFFILIINRLGHGKNEPLNREISSPPLVSSLSLSSAPSIHSDPTHLPEPTIHPRYVIATVWMVFLLNIVVVGTMNGLYIASTLQNISSDVRIWIQFSFGLFSALWSMIALQGLPSGIKESKYGLWLFVCVTVVNSVIIPSFATALSSPSCYQVR